MLRLDRTATEQADFKPSSLHRMAAYWFWFSLPTDDQIESQLRDFRDKGYRTILIQARLSMPREVYLSQSYLERYRKAVATMQRLGLVSGLYDDYNWTSGQAGGRTVRDAPHLRERHLFFASFERASGTISGIRPAFLGSMGPDINGWVYEGGLPVFGDWELVAAVVHPEMVSDTADIRDVTASVSVQADGDGCRFQLSDPLSEGHRLTVFIAARCLTSRLVNYLLPEAGERFVEVGLEPYASALDGLMGDTVQFLFYDQPAPQFYVWNEQTGNLGNTPLYAEQLKRIVESAGPEGFAIVLLSLVQDIGARTPALRLRFYENYATLIDLAFFGPLKDFCRRNGLSLTGHEILPHVGSFALNGGFTSIDPRVAPAVDFFGIDAIRDMTAIDVNNFDRQLSPRMGDSVARANGRSRTIAEIYATATRTERRGAGQWELSPATLRAQMIRLHMSGVRQVIIHALYQNDGADGDFRLFANPRFDFAPGLNFEPWWPLHPVLAEEAAYLSAFIEDIRPHVSVGVLYPLATAYVEGPRHAHASHIGQWCDAFDALSTGFIFLDEDSIARGEIRDGRLLANGLEFRALVLPATTVLRSSAVTRQIEAFARSGGKVWLSGCFPRDETGEMLATGRLFESVPERDVLKTMVADLDPGISRVETADDLRYLEGPDETGGWRIVLFNDSPKKLSARISVQGQLSLLDAESGSTIEGGEVSILSLDLQPHDLVCLLIKPQPGTYADAVWPAKQPEIARVLALEDGWLFHAADGDRPQPIRVDLGWQAQGHAAFSGTGRYGCNFELDQAADCVLDLPGVEVAVEVTIDGRPAGARIRPPYRIALGRLAAGPHTLSLAVSNTAANRYYAGTPYAGQPWPDESGLTAIPRLFLLQGESLEEDT